MFGLVSLISVVEVADMEAQRETGADEAEKKLRKGREERVMLRLFLVEAANNARVSNQQETGSQSRQDSKCGATCYPARLSAVRRHDWVSGTAFGEQLRGHSPDAGRRCSTQHSKRARSRVHALQPECPA
jgi:hypothetical protein